jgi:glyoxylase-like metal-dependent hydrolase (beta-lactamase superfamily II)
MRIIRPSENILAFYEGRDGARYAEEPNWVDEGALSLGIASYAVLDGDSALIYDTHVSVDRAERIRATLAGMGVTRFTVLLSHWHLDHVAGTAAFEDCEILAGRRTGELLSAHRDAIEAGEHEGPPAIDPLILPTRTIDGKATLTVGSTEIELIPVNIHSDDAVVVWLPEQELLLAGDTMEDTITYVGEPESFDRHLADLDCLDELGPKRILPSHGDPEVIADGGYSRGLIRATQQYIRTLMRLPAEPGLRDSDLRTLIAGPLDARWINYFEGYEAVHAENVETVLKGLVSG